MSAISHRVLPPRVSSISAAAQSLVATLPHALWRGNQMASYRGAVMASGHAALDRELPNGGWPHSALIELLVQQAGSGEIQLLQPVLTALTQQNRRVILLQPPHIPQIAACRGWGLATQRMLWVKTTGSADALWAAEQILRNGSCGALLFWQPHIRTDALRRLHLAAQASDTMLWMIRPLSAAHESSPAPLRLLLRPANNGIEVQLLKRRGPQHDQSLYLAWGDNDIDNDEDGASYKVAARSSNTTLSEPTTGQGSTPTISSDTARNHRPKRMVEQNKESTKTPSEVLIPAAEPAQWAQRELTRVDPD
ncbi:translesion DNA synthesis-associated protein ImuA [Glaciimonas immobilis]|uniref:Protein ImuA n=1 Tax=Glaciimonas immobilis TaxID=728004 RepID=A0A840RQF7_9BURK|nr:translesion DNA synthesis-associated protein ImuA [Glaciimonas immobilis]KAF3999256.1 translesion DNA synthesis-associated protein ImuA [Glaciimonas immobilis]MBB5198719.1 protein ImuA [Glaciimonas immobilis]